ncbi:MAG: porin [Hyphomicrobiaceae bacterium]
MRADGLKDGATEQAVTNSQRGDDERCRRYGPGYSAVGDSGLCAYVGGGVLVQAAKEFTGRDVFLTGQRIPTLFTGGAGVPMVYYHVDDVSKQTKYPAIGTIASAHMMVRGESNLGLMRGFIRVTADARTHYEQDDGSVSVDLRQIDDSYYIGALEEAWVQWDGLKVGIQPSLFGFNRLPSVVTPGYTSIVTTLGASYTHVITPNMSVSLGAEDSGRRLMGEGVLARPSRSDTPDVVALFRMATPSTLFHLSGAVHHAEDHVVSDFDAGSAKRVAGWAWSAGLQSRVKWDDLLGSAGYGQLGRLGLTLANASGALGYLGVPLFSPDYVVGGDGAVNRSTGWSALASYEHMLAPRMKLNLNATFFDLTMHSSPEEVIPHLDSGVPALPELNFEVDVRGTVLQAGVEYMLATGMVVGFESGYTTTEAKGRYIEMQGGKVSVGFPHIGIYLRQSF